MQFGGMVVPGLSCGLPSRLACGLPAGLRAGFPTSLVAIGLVAAAFLSAGCSKVEGPLLMPVSGKLLVDGKPIQGITVMFLPDKSKGTSGPASVGVTDAEGAFSLAAAGNRKGAVVGHHRVTASCPFNPAGGSSADGQAQAATACSLPAAYGDPGRSPLTVEVVSDAARNTSVSLEVVTKK
ncbi:MAG: hypothetical protein ACKOTB_02745 [Planctomycetia bacterium]